MPLSLDRQSRPHLDKYYLSVRVRAVGTQTVADTSAQRTNGKEGRQGATTDSRSHRAARHTPSCIETTWMLVRCYHMTALVRDATGSYPLLAVTSILN